MSCIYNLNSTIVKVYENTMHEQIKKSHQHTNHQLSYSN